MAKFIMELPTDIMKDIQKIHDNSDQIFGEMTKAGANVALTNARASIPEVLRPYLRLTRTYKTPSDDGINTKVIVKGWIPFKGNRTTFSRRGKKGGQVYVTNKGIPAEFLANLYEYGRSTSPFPKRPWLRRSFNKGQIEKAMLEAQKKASGGLLE